MMTTRQLLTIETETETETETEIETEIEIEIEIDLSYEACGLFCTENTLKC